MYNIIQTRKIWLSLSSFLVILSLIFLFVWGLKPGIDFTGGSLLEARFKGDRPSAGEVREALAPLNLGSLTVQPSGEENLILRFQDTGEEKHQEILKKLSEIAAEDGERAATSGEAPNANEAEKSPINIENLEIIASGTVQNLQVANPSEEFAGVEELRFDSVGPSIGKELKSKSFSAVFIVVIFIIIYIAWAFRKVSKPVASWKYGLAATVALFHDVIITMGAFALMGKYFGAEVNTPFVAAILTVLGYSVNDTIVVFDRIRENLPKSNEDFEGTVNTSVNQTIARSINTSLTTLLVLLSIVFFGGASIRDFALALSIGIFVGTYSSIFLASPLLVIWEKMKRN